MLVMSESRINFGIDYYDNLPEAQAMSSSLIGAPYGETKWGQPFGRDASLDKDGLYAVVVP